MKRLLFFACVLASCAISCANRDNRPAWAKLPESGVAGESTITGAPLAVHRFASKPNLDGKLDDAVWASAAIAGPLVQPGKGEEATKSPVNAFGRLGWDDQNLYVGVVVGDKSPGSPFGRDDADPHLWEKSSAIELMIQPGDFPDNRQYLEIQIDVNGAVFDTSWDDYNKPITGDGESKVFGHMDWSSKPERAVFTEPGKYYSIEAAIPWSSLPKGRVSLPPKPGDVWKLNLYSFRDGQRLALAWSPIRGQGNFHKSSRFGRIKFD
ncbi:MAG: carbohydrate-binding family 9-like protein [Polyangiales bacterium]